jgi:hypothetical protein
LLEAEHETWNDRHIRVGGYASACFDSKHYHQHYIDRKNRGLATFETSGSEAGAIAESNRLILFCLDDFIDAKRTDCFMVTVAYAAGRPEQL